MRVETQLSSAKERVATGVAAGGCGGARTLLADLEAACVRIRTSYGRVRCSGHTKTLAAELERVRQRNKSTSELAQVPEH